MKNRVRDLLLIVMVLSGIISCKNDNPAREYSYDMKISAQPLKWYAGECNSLGIIVKNTGKIPWVVLEDNIKWRVRISYHIFEGEKLVTEGMRTDFNRTVHPGESVSLNMNILLPPQPGNYKVVVDMLKESKFWFKDINNTPIEVSVTAENPLAHSTITAGEEESGSFEKFVKKSRELNSSFRVYIPYSEVRETLKLIARNYEKNLTSKNSKVTGWFPGSIYPQVWLRDSYYHAAASGFLYSQETTRKMLEEFIDYSSVRRGYVPDYISPDGESADYTVASDRYPFLILLACKYINQTGDYEWLSKPAGKTTMYHHLNSVVEQLYPKVFDEKSGLYFSGHTADWGDVEFEDDGSDSQQFGRSSHRVAGIYTQALFYSSLVEWADILYRVHLYQQSMTYLHRADILKAKVEEALWKEKQGFFRIHSHIDPLKHNFNEKAIFALGGNIWAVRSGLADTEKAARILDNIKSIKDLNAFPTISRTLQPPYPRNFFKNPSLSEPGVYQNGGFWDWYGGLAVLEEFRVGRYEEAVSHMREITSEVATLNNLYEWYDQALHGQGSLHYLASGSVIFESLVKGYYGLYQKKDIWQISPALDTVSRSVFFHRPERGLLIAYRIQPIPSRRTVIFEYDLAGQKSFDLSLPIAVMKKSEFIKNRRSYDKWTYFFDEKISILFYRNSLPEGKGSLKISY